MICTCSVFIWGSIWSTDGREDVAYIWPVYIMFYTLPKGVYTGSKVAEKGLSLILCPYDVQTIFGLPTLHNLL